MSHLCQKATSYVIYGVMERKIQEKNWTRLKQDLLKGSRKWIVWK